MQISNPSLTELFKTPRRKTYTLAGFTAITVGLFAFFALRPTFVKIADLNAEIKDKKEFLVKIDDKLTTVNDLIQQKQSVSQELVYFDKALPEDKKAGFLVANLAEIAEKYDILLVSVESKAVESDKQVSMSIDIPPGILLESVNVSLEGEIDSIEKYLEHLELFPRILDVVSISYRKNDPGLMDEGQGKFYPYVADLSFNVFHWDPNAELVFEESTEPNPEDELVPQE
ncbi:MAG: hypothetical protein PHS44_06895 [Candidatus Dojkabacteria bacterium]|nr:hypothetical protein [Candidatus Dojkabacteria bacterium]